MLEAVVFVRADCVYRSREARNASQNVINRTNCEVTQRCSCALHLLPRRTLLTLNL